MCPGYRVSGTHANPLGLKTDAPPEVFWDIMRCWVAEHPQKKPPEADSYAGKLLAKPPQLKADFSRARGATSAAKSAKVGCLLIVDQVVHTEQLGLCELWKGSGAATDVILHVLSRMQVM